MTASAMGGNGQPGPDKAGLKKLPKAKRIAMILSQREDTRIRLAEKDQQITELSEQLAKLQGETDKKKAGQKIGDINKQVNQPTSKKPEWYKDGNPKPTTKGQKNKKKKRKIRAFIDAFSQYRSIMKFYLKLRRIIREGEKLQAARDGLNELVFQRRLKALEQKLDALLRWKNPNDTLNAVIKKVCSQKEHILTLHQA